MDAVNRRAWSDPWTVRTYQHLEGWIDRGERAAMECIREACAGSPILDLGVGGGRTVPILRAISADYVGLDYTPELVRACQAKYPGVRILCGDARDLSRFDDASFGLVVFSYNGIDAVNALDRATILREAHRVLRRGGVLLFSTHNRNGPAYEERFSLGIDRTSNPVKLGARVVVALLHAGRAARNYDGLSRLRHDGDGYAIRNGAELDHGVLVHYISAEAQRSQLASVGFGSDPLVFANRDGRLLAPGEDTHDVSWFHLVVRKS
ncbi:MAG: class I SAM-dependent methyltransferase [Polyangiaceae bacterium]